MTVKCELTMHDDASYKRILILEVRSIGSICIGGFPYPIINVYT